MKIILSQFAARRLTPPVPYQAGLAAVAVFEQVLKKDYATGTDILEIGSIPGTARIVSATLIGAGFTAGTTATIAAIDGDPGDDGDDSRDFTGPALFTNAAVDDNETPATATKCLSLPVSDAHRGLGVKLSANEAASPGKKLTLLLEYTY
jgi:hypothetical protein